MGTAALVFFVLIFYNRITRIVSAVAVMVAALFIFFTFERWEAQAEHLHDVTLMIRGYLHYSPELGVTILWAISLLFGLVVAVFMLFRFSFYLLTLTGVAIFLFTWGPGFTRDTVSFLLFLICFCLLLIRKTNLGLSAVYVAAPICAALVWFIQSSVPMEADLFQRRTLQELFDGPLATVGDFIYMMTNPMYFSFQATGFSGQGGRLGGPVTPNNRNVMTVMAPGRTYLAGATHNTYTGYSWITTLEPGQLYTQGMHPSQFEKLETTVSLIRNATHISDRSIITSSVLWGIFPATDHRHLTAQQFPALGVGDYMVGSIMRVGERVEFTGETAFHGEVFVDGRILNGEQFGLVFTNFATRYLHTYLPIDQVTVAIGTNRTGTVFRPHNTRSIWFHPAGPDYLPSLVFDPIGDMRAPGFMARGTQYTMGFLNVDHRLSFISDILNASFKGFHANQGAQVFYFPFTSDNRELVQYFYNIYLTQNPDDYLCNLTYATLIFYELEHYVIGDYEPLSDDYFDTENYEQEGDAFSYIREFYVRVPRADLTGVPQHDVSVTVHDINGIFEMFAYQGPNRNVQYMPSYSLLTAKLDAFSRDVLTVYAKTVREHFMYVPEIVPQRVHDLVAEIIYGLETDYERVLAIRDYLIQFPYTLSPQPVPLGVCFVDYFLFEGREGYCTYYASAMAVMSRIAGVPSRYVEGFLLPPAPAEAENNEAIFVVTNMMAHAWVEVYLEGFGWFIVEATAPYALFIDPGLITIPRPDIQQSWIGDEWWWYMDEYYWNQMFGYIDGDFPFTPGIAPPGGPSGSTPDGTVVDGSARSMITLELVRNIVLVLAVTIFVAVLAFLMMQYVKICTVARRVKRLPINRQITTYFAGILAIASHVTWAKNPTETAHAYGQRVGMRFAFKNDSARLRDLVNLYYRARYGNRQLSDSERGVMEESYFDMVNHLRIEHKRSRFFYLRYILRIGAI